MIRRREVVTLLAGGAAAFPLAARAQQPERMRLVGVLSNVPEDDEAMKARFAAFRQELEKRGWLQNRNVQIETRFGAITSEQIQASAKALLALQPDVILSNAPHVARELQQATRTVPIVFVGVSDPIGAGLIASLARPGGNLTGLQNYEATITGKWLAMLKEIAPAVERAALMGNPSTTDFAYFLEAAERSAPSLAIKVVSVRVGNTPPDIERAIETFAREPNGSLVLPPDGSTSRTAISLSVSQRATACPRSMRFGSS